MANCKKTPSFIAEFALITSPLDERELGIRLSAGRAIYNACLGESLRRLDLMRESKAWQAARAMPSTVEGKPNEAKTKVFKALREKFRFNSGSIQAFGEKCRDACWIGDHLGSHDTQTTTLRAFRAVEQYMFGSKGRPRFKSKVANDFESIEGKALAAVIRYKAEPEPSIHYCALTLPLILDPKDKKHWQKDALACRVKFARILKREIKGRTRWYTQLVLEGVAPTKGRKIGEGDVSLDIGPSTVASFSLEEAKLEPFCPSVVQPWQELRVVERAMDRSRRATNPENYNPDKTVKKGKKKWIRSGRYQKLAGKRKERERRLAAERKRSHGQLSNELLARGKSVKTEKLSYKSFQKCFGRSVKVRAPGLLIAILKRKTKAADGQLIEISTRNTRLSQYDHTTGLYTPKPLSQREHVFGDGVTAPLQRDLYSAFLAFCCSANILDIRQVQKTWPSAEPLLRQAMSSETKSASGRASRSPQGVTTLRADRLSKRSMGTGQGQSDAVEVVAQARATESKGVTILSEPPGFIHGEVQRLK